MRLWSIHPQYLDAKGLVALWRETLLAQAVLAGKTKGYKNHPQLLRFKACKNPISAIGRYLIAIHDEATNRGYTFDRKKILKTGIGTKIKVTNGQLAYERTHLLKKLKVRDRKKYAVVSKLKKFDPHPIFRVEIGPVEEWEKLSL